MQTENEQFAFKANKQNYANQVKEEVLAEKLRQIAAMKARQHDMDLRMANYVEEHPEAVTAAKNYVQRFLASERHKRFHWILDRWILLLETKTPRELADILRDTSEATEQLRSSPPFCGIEFDT